MFHRYTERILSGGQKFLHLLRHWPVSIRLSKGYYHCDRLRSYLHRLLHLPTSGKRRNAAGAYGCRFSVKQEMVHCVFLLLTLRYFTVVKTIFGYKLEVLRHSMFIILLCVQLCIMISNNIRQHNCFIMQGSYNHNA